jgi:hypothetical protein
VRRDGTVRSCACDRSDDSAGALGCEVGGPCWESMHAALCRARLGGPGAEEAARSLAGHIASPAVAELAS